MQTFKEISYQNYIELRFNQKNLNQLTENQALIQYKRNAQLLAQIFLFEKKPRTQFIAEPVITEEHLKNLEKEISHEKEEGERKCLELQLKSQRYCEIMKRAKNLKNQEQREQLIQQLKQIDLYDHRHPYFAEQSPFFMNKTEQQFLEVTTPPAFNPDKFSLIELRPTPTDKLQNK